VKEIERMRTMKNKAKDKNNLKINEVKDIRE
jgi:hypothetical protein